MPTNAPAITRGQRLSSVLALAMVLGAAGCAGPLPGAPQAAAALFSIQADYVVSADAGGGGEAWNLRMIGVQPVAVPALSGARQVVAAVIDTGVDPAHPELKAELLPMIDLVGGDRYRKDGKDVDYSGRDGNGHGTHVAGIVHSTVGPNNPIGILALKAIGNSGIGDDGTIAGAIRRAVDWRDPANPSRRVRVINLSIGGKTSSRVLEEALDYATRRDVLVVVAAGNRTRDVDYPAALPTALAVSATTVRDGIADYSNRGLTVGISAPGGDSDASISSTWPTYLTASDYTKRVRSPHDHGTMVGTSMAAPHVTGAAALLFAQDPTLSARQVRARLQTWTQDLGPLGPDGYFGVGRLMVGQVLQKGAHDAN
ncbi:S8 family serine peptidase [bacterium]|nr:S8 family serine peptidase [bacterium]